MISVKNYEIYIKTSESIDVLNITDVVSQKLSDSKIKDGILVVHVAGSTASVSTIEYEDGVIWDLKKRIKEIIPMDIDYRHDLKWGDGNGYAHVGACIFGPSLSLPVIDGKLALGTWQQIVLIDFDNRERKRKILAQIMGAE